MGDPLTPYEAESLVESLECLALEEVGTKKWLRQHQRIERLNAHAHRQAKEGTDEYVVDHLTTLGKIPVVIHCVLTIELWKAKVLPLVKEHVSKRPSELRSDLPRSIVHQPARVLHVPSDVMRGRRGCRDRFDGLLLPQACVPRVGTEPRPVHTGS